MKLTKQIVLDARSLIECDKNWGKGAPKTYNDCYCLGGAISEAATGDAQNMYADFELFDDFVVRAELPRNDDYLYEPEWIVAEFNDYTRRTHSEVLALLDKVANTFDV